MFRFKQVTTWIQLGAVVLLGGAIWAGFKYLPYGFPNTARYFDEPANRSLQDDEVGQLRSVEETFFSLSLSGDDFRGWNTEEQHFWKYSIAFAAYGLPSAMIIDP